jgi:hypothetical protein
MARARRRSRPSSRRGTISAERSWCTSAEAHARTLLRPAVGSLERQRLAGGLAVASTQLPISEPVGAPADAREANLRARTEQRMTPR